MRLKVSAAPNESMVERSMAFAWRIFSPAIEPERSMTMVTCRSSAPARASSLLAPSVAMK